MTGAQTEPVSVPAYQTAVSLLLKLANPLFLRAINEPHGFNAWHPNFTSWVALRGFASLLLMRRTVDLSNEETIHLNLTLVLAHELSHEGEVCSPPAFCECETARQIADLLRLLNLDGCES
jgi:hypothetical protein